MEEQIKQIFDVVALMVDHVANSDQGGELIDNYTKITLRAYNNLVEGGMPPEHAASICSNMSSSLGKQNN